MPRSFGPRRASNSLQPERQHDCQHGDCGHNARLLRIKTDPQNEAGEQGLPSDDEFVAMYCERMGISGIDDFGFCLAFCFFRMAAVLQGVKKRALDGNASNPEKGLKMGEYVPVFAAHGIAALDR